MSEIVFNDRLYGYQIAKAAGVEYNPSVDICIANKIHGELAGGVLYNNFTGASISIHVASFRPNWLSRDFLWVVFDYPFNQLGVKKLFGSVCETNVKALEFDLKLGFIEEHRIREVYPDGDMILLAMKRDTCRWLNIQPKSFERRSSR